MKKELGLYIFLLLLMLFTTIWASLQQNLFTEFSLSNSPMWFKATLIDFYINQFVLWLIVFHLESKWGQRIFWLIIFITLGSMGTCAYAILKIIQKKKHFYERSL